MNVITSTKELARFCTELARNDYVTVDTEFMRERTFWPILCLVQLAGPDEAAAVDPLADGIDLAPLFELMADPDVLKVMHGSRQDVEIFHHLTGHVPTPLYDTQIAAMVCGFGEQVGYETLISKLTGGRLDKGSRFTDWAQRPLTEKQLAYAIDDVVHLRPAFEKLRDRISADGRETWLEEDMANLSDPALYEITPELAWRRLKPKSTSRRYLAILREVAAWRETEAVTRDVPRNRILRDESLGQIAAHPPADIQALGRARGISKGFAEGRQGQSLLKAVAAGLALDPMDAPQPIVKPERPAGLGPVIELLKVLLKHKCERHSVAQKLVANAADLESIAADDADDVPAMHGWRYEVFGADALRLKQSELALAAQGGQIQLIEVSADGQADLSATSNSQPSQNENSGRNGKRRRRRRSGGANNTQTDRQSSIPYEAPEGAVE